jgi:hypothetical protein
MVQHSSVAKCYGLGHLGINKNPYVYNYIGYLSHLVRVG